MSNIFDLHGIDPLSTADEITQRFRELIEDAADADRQALRDAWEALTLHPRSRIGIALSTFIDPEPCVVELPPQTRGRPAPAGSQAASSLARLSQAQKALLVPVSDVLASMQRKHLCLHEPTAHVPLASDPLLEDPRP